MYWYKIKVWSLLLSLAMFMYWWVAVAQNIALTRWVNHCGDWVLRTDLWEMCDDGNYLDGDWCSRNCEDETMLVPDVNQNVREIDFPVSDTTWYKVFIKGSFSHSIEVVRWTENEICDYGVDNGMICDPWYGWICYYCSETCTLESVVGQSCGDWFIYHLEEQCDDGNVVSGDGCSSSCRIEKNLPELGQIVPPTSLPAPTQAPNPLIGQIVPPTPLPLPTQEPTEYDPLVLEPITVQEDILQEVEIQEQVRPLEIVEPRPSLQITNVDLGDPVIVPQPIVQQPDLIQVTPTISIENDTPIQEVSSENNSTALVLEPIQSVAVVDSSEHIQDIQMRQNIVMRSTPKKAWIWITKPYPENLSKTWADLVIPSHQVFMLLLSGLLSCYFAVLVFARKFN